jgi:hypothetical protein
LLNSTALSPSDFTTAQVIATVQSGVNPGGLTVEEAHILLASGSGISTDNCTLS